MKVSIIIPVYNVEPYIERCLLSVLNQTYQDIEIILVDDCGQDNSMVVAQQTVDNHSNGYKVRILKHEHNRGLSAARNTGTKEAKGEYIYYLDSDDEITINAINSLMELAKENNFPDFIVGGVETVGNAITPNYLKLKKIYIDSNTEILDTYVNREWYVMAWNKLVRTDFLKKEELYFKEGIIHEDTLWSLLLANKAQTMGILQDLTYKYYYRNNSIMNCCSIKNIKSQIEIIDDISAYLRKEVIDLNINNITYYENRKDILLNLLFSNHFSSSIKLEYYSKLKKTDRYLKNKWISFLSITKNISFLFPTNLGYWIMLLFFSKNLDSYFV